MNKPSVHQILKRAVFAAWLLPAIPLALAAMLERRVTRGELLFGAIAQMLALLPTPIGTGIRGAFYFLVLDDCSWETHIGFGSLFTHARVCVGSHVSMGSYCIIGHAILGDGIRMGSRVSIPSGKRQHLDESGNLSARDTFDTVTIGAKTWIGEGAILMADVGRACIVSAGAVVTRCVPDFSLVAGNPGRVIRQLSTSEPCSEAH
jgi:acetyltransferase-like isoleucine patch superfamily enzyme